MVASGLGFGSAASLLGVDRADLLSLEGSEAGGGAETPLATRVFFGSGALDGGVGVVAAVVSGALFHEGETRGGACGGAETRGGACGGAETRGGACGGAETGGGACGGAETRGGACGGAETRGGASGGAETRGGAGTVRTSAWRATARNPSRSATRDDSKLSREP